MFRMPIRPGTHYPHVTWAHVTLRVQLGYLTLNSGADSLLSTLLTSRDLTWSSGRLTWQHASQISVVAHIPWDVTYVPSALQRCYQLFPEIEETLIEKVRQRTFLYDTKSPGYRGQHMRVSAWEEIGKELKIKLQTWRELTWSEDSMSPA
jgi:hypothetical protein